MTKYNNNEDDVNGSWGDAEDACKNLSPTKAWKRRGLCSAAKADEDKHNVNDSSDDAVLLYSGNLTDHGARAGPYFANIEMVAHGHANEV